MRGLRERLGSIWDRFGVDLGRSEVAGVSAGAGRGALLSKFTFFGFASASGSILRLPDPLLEPLRPSLGALWGNLIAPWAPLWGPRAPSVPLRALLWTLLGALLGALGRPWDPRWLPGRFEDRFGVDLGSIFGRFRTDFWWIFFAVCTRLCSAGASSFRSMACS